MLILWEKIKTWAVMPILGVPAAAIVGVVAVGAYLFLGKKKGRGKRLF
jgi:hypothetical protein